MVGKTLKHYRIEALLGRGGMGSVYKAFDLKLARPVAVKVLREDLVADETRRARFLQEARAAAAVSHPSIAQVYDIDEDAGTMFIAMEYIDGRTVRELVASGELDIQSTVEIAARAAEGVAKAHEAKVIHRDVKPDNIMVTRDGHVKILDFGLAKLLEAGETAPGDAADSPAARTLTMPARHTAEGTVLGTLSYMSPEQARGKALDPRSDIFSFGIVLYEMATGRLPFGGETPIDTMHAIVYEDAAQPVSLRAGLPFELQRIILRCLQKRPEDRYPNAGELASELDRLKRDLESGVRPRFNVRARVESLGERIRSGFPYGAKGLILLSAVVALTVTLVVFKVRFSALITPAVAALLIYRWVRNRKKRLVAAAVRKMARIPELRAVFFRDDRLTVVLKRAPVNAYIKISGLTDDINKSLFLGKPVTVETADDVSAEKLRGLLNRGGALYLSPELESSLPFEVSSQSPS